MSKPTVEIGVMRGAYRGMMALDIDSTRHGPDAGPWTTVETFRVDAAELIRVAEQAIAEQVIAAEKKI